MNTNLKKRKKASFNTYKAVRASISFNNIQHFGNNMQNAMMVNDYENSWIEQMSELKSNEITNIQSVSKQHKLITKWWENN